MLFNSVKFLYIFLPIVFCIYFILNHYKKYGAAKVWLLVSSLYFYADYDHSYLKIIISSILFNYICGLIILEKININLFKKNKKLVLILALIGNLGLLGYYKYWSFLIECFNNLANQHFNTMHILLPLGISFFTFQQISYIIDCYKGEAKYTNITDYALFVSFFPQLISGPIVHHKEIIPQFEDNSKKVINHTNISLGLFLIAVGLAKKVLLADTMCPFVNTCLSDLNNIDIYSSWAFALTSVFEGYFDFSGYCDLALGIGYLFNIELPINFNSPFKSEDMGEYWRRWHITLGRFLKYYVYIPLGGSRAGTIRTYINLMIVFVVTGIWHGANWSCIAFGVVNGVLVCINKYWRQLGIQINKNLAKVITFGTLLMITPLVKVTTFQQYIQFLSAFLGLSGNYKPVEFLGFNIKFYSGNEISILMLIFCSIAIFFFPNSNELGEKYIKNNNIVYSLAVAFVIIYASLSFSQTQSFIYFQF